MICSDIFDIVPDMESHLPYQPDNDGPVLAPRQARGRGARSNQSGRYEPLSRSWFNDGWQSLEDLPKFKTTVTSETARSIVTRNESPDLGFERSINTYRGCEHGCAYCYARPTHAFMGLSPGIDFESRLFAKTNAPDLLRDTLLDPAYKPATIVLGTNTDPYQPVERQYRLTRQILHILDEFSHPVGIVTKSSLVVRDIDILKSMAERGLSKVAISLTTLDHRLSRSMEPRASAPGKRLRALEMLSQAGIPAAVMVAPVIPAVNDHEIEKIIAAASLAGVCEAGYIMLRLPLEVRDIFMQWLKAEMPGRYDHVMSLVRSIHRGKTYDSAWHHRQTGTGPYAWSIGRRFEIACKRHKLNARCYRLNTGMFKRPPQPGEQLSLF